MMTIADTVRQMDRASLSVPTSISGVLVMWSSIIKVCVCVAFGLVDGCHPVMLESLPTQLDAVKPATEFPAERHRWNTNEVHYM